MSEYPHELLIEARAKAQRLVSGLETQKAELEANPPVDIAPEKLAVGRMAMTNALAAAKRSLAALEDAIRIAHYDEARRGES